ASPYAVFTVSGAPGQWVDLVLQSGSAAGGSTAPADGSVDFGAQALQYFNGTAWVSYSSGARVALNASGQLLVRTTVVNDLVYEGAQNFTLLASNTSGAVAIGTATVLDDGTGDIFNSDGSKNLTAVKNDDRPGAPADKPAEPAPVAAMPALPASPPSLHVQGAVAQAQAEQSGAATQSVGAPILQTAAGGQFTTALAQAQIEAFARPTDPNLFVLPAVSQARYEALIGQIPTLMMQSGLLIPSGPLSGSSMGPLWQLSDAGALPTDTSLADQTLAQMMSPDPQEVQLSAVEAEAQDDLAQKQARQLAAAREAAQQAAAATPAPNGSGQLSFSKKLQREAAQRSPGGRWT
ncbi:MAG: hypothetical protein LW719_09560, partial [Comamonadaceae bacterium]|nr:hypothetical protein [Comamonadaceae bacterium]